MTKQEIIKAVQDLPIYEKDYNTILFLMNNLEPKLFVKIIEEIVEGNLFISDFERIFSDEAYSDMLKNNLEKQAELDAKMKKLINFRKTILNDETFTLDPKTNFIGIRRVNKETDPGYEFYEEERQRVRDNLISELFYTMSNDSDIVRAVKLRLYRLILMNQSAYSPDDLLIFAKSYIIPLSIEEETLDKFDYEFMFSNGITELEMKKVKVLSKLLKRKDLGGEF
jgi:hypothetical protein